MAIQTFPPALRGMQYIWRNRHSCLPSRIHRSGGDAELSFRQQTITRATLRRGGVIAYPTEAVWGYGCDPFNAKAVERLLAIKQRDWRKGLILVAANETQLEPLLAPLTAQQRALLQDSWPGPFTWLIPDPEHWLPHWVKGVHNSVAVRVSAHPVVQALCLAWGGALISTSANRSGLPPARTELALRRDLQACDPALHPDHIVPGATLGLAKPTAIRDLLSQRIVRQG